MRILQPAFKRDRSSDLARPLRQRAGETPSDGVDEGERRNLASGEDVRADRDDVGARWSRILVEALESRRQQGERRFTRELLDELLVELSALGREGNHALSGAPPYTASSAAATTSTRSTIPSTPGVGVVVDLAGAQRRRFAVVEDAEVELGSEYRCEGSALPNPVERSRNEREDVEAHDGEP